MIINKLEKPEDDFEDFLNSSYKEFKNFTFGDKMFLILIIFLGIWLIVYFAWAIFK